MLSITKGPPPPVWANGVTAMRRADQHRWQDISKPMRDAAIEALLEEQHHLCAYCCRRVRRSDTGEWCRIEHVKSRNPPKGVDASTWGDQHILDWANLVLVCPGRAGDLQTCDRSRGNLKMPLNPSKPPPRPETALVYTRSGRVSVRDDVESCDAIRHQLDTTLNLNAIGLIEQRKRVLMRLKKLANRSSGRLSTSQLQRMRSEFAPADGSPWQGFASVALSWIDRRLARE